MIEIHFNIFGAEQIDQGAMHQMYREQNCALPLMPDAYHGYGLPIVVCW
jgi:tRNA-splicing ligase RtcB